MFLMVSSQIALADGVCSSSKWTPIDTTVKYGDSVKTALAKLKSKYGNTASVSLDKDTGNILVGFAHNNRKIFDIIAYMVMEDTVYKVVFSYSNPFQSSFGGLSPAVVALAKKMIERVGEKADDVKQEGPEFLAHWDQNDGAVMEVYGKDPNVLLLRFTCETLEQTLQQKKRSSTNFGF